MEMNETTNANVLEERFIEERVPLIEAYDKLGFIDNPHAPPLRNDWERAVMAQLLDNIKFEMTGSQESIEAIFERQRKMREAGLLEATTPIKTTAWSGATMLPVVLGFVRKMMPKMIALELVQTQPMSKPSGRVFYVNRIRHDDGTDKGYIEARAGWSYRSWIDDPGEATNITKTVKFTIDSADVTAKTHKLKAELSMETIQDLAAYLDMDAVALASDAATDEFALELDEILLYQLYQSRGTLVYYGAKPSGYTVEEWDRRLIEALVRADELAYNKHRTRTNWMVVGSEMSVRLQRLATFESVPEADRPVVPAGLVRIGTLNNRWRVYEMPKPFPTDEALLGYKGTNWTDGVLFYLPYILLRPYGTDQDVDKMQTTISWYTRYATYMPTNAGNGLAVVKIDETKTGLSYPAWTEWTS